MKTKTYWLLAIAILLFSGLESRASGPCGIYARIDEVRTGPDEANPTYILIKGDFVVAKDSHRFESPVRGYLCLSLEKTVVDRDGGPQRRVPLTGKQKDRCLIEWDDLKNLVEEKGAGKAFVAFGSEFSEVFRSYPEVYGVKERALEDPFPHPVQHGLTKLRAPSSRDRGNRTGNSERNPVVLLLDFQTKKEQEAN